MIYWQTFDYSSNYVMKLGEVPDDLSHNLRVNKMKELHKLLSSVFCMYLLFVSKIDK